MASLLRQIVAGPRARHDETGLDLCYVTDDIIAMSGPSQTYPQLAYRNPLDKLVAYLDKKHGSQWAIWEFRAEGTGYPDDAVYGRIRHYPWPDHHPPPFKLVPMILKSMRAWLAPNEAAGSEDQKRVVVVHCKAGKGRSGSMACAYLIAERGWSVADAVARFTARRMRPQFGPGVSIASQVRWIGYVGRWAQAGKPAYPGLGGASVTATDSTETDPAVSEGDTEILEIHVWGLRHGVKVAVEGYIDDGRKIHVYHTFRRHERYVVQGDAPGGGGFVDFVTDAARLSPAPGLDGTTTLINGGNVDTAQLQQQQQESPSRSSSPADSEPGGRAVLFKPATPIRVAGRDINIAIERRNKPGSSFKSVARGLTMVTSVAHFWFNTYFEGNGPEQGGRPDDNGVFALDWDQLDGIKGSTTKGTRAAERIAVVWRAVPSVAAPGIAPVEIRVDGVQAADWKGNNKEDPDANQRLGLRPSDPSSADVSRASSIHGVPADGSSSSSSSGPANNAPDLPAQTKTSGPEGEALDSSV